MLKEPSFDAKDMHEADMKKAEDIRYLYCNRQELCSIVSVVLQSVLNKSSYCYAEC